MPVLEIAAFDRHITRARDLCGIATTLRAQLSDAIDLSDIYRAAFVQGVSAFDTFVHAEVRVRMLDIFSNSNSARTPAFEKFRVSLNSTSLAILNSGNSAAQLNWLDNEIREQHSYLSFQQPEKVADAVRLISDVVLWQALADHLGQNPVGGESGAKVLKRRLALIVDRRNTIVHESDVDPTLPGVAIYPMDQQTAEGALDFLQLLGHGIQAVT